MPTGKKVTVKRDKNILRIRFSGNDLSILRTCIYFMEQAERLGGKIIQDDAIDCLKKGEKISIQIKVLFKYSILLRLFMRKIRMRAANG